MYFKSAKIIELQNNPQYRIIQSGSDKWLMNVDNNKFGFVFYPLNWLTPQKVYKLSDEEFSDLVAINSRGGRAAKILIPSGAILGVVLVQYVKLDIDTNEWNSGSYLPLVYIFLILVLASTLRLLLTKLRGKRVEQKVIISNLQVENLLIRPAKITGKLVRFFLSYLIILFLTILSLALVLNYNSWFFLLAFLLFLSGLFFTNSLSFLEGDYVAKAILK